MNVFFGLKLADYLFVHGALTRIKRLHAALGNFFSLKRRILDLDISSESIDDHSVDDLKHIQTNLNNIDDQDFEQKMDHNGDNKEGEEDIHKIIPQQPSKEEVNNKVSNPESKAESSDLSRPPGFEFMKKSPSFSSKCSTSFARYRKKDIKSLVDFPIGGRCFTWMNKAGTKLSKLDRFLISEDVIDLLLDVRTTALDKIWSDHNPILLHVDKIDFGPSPFKLYNSWHLRDGQDRHWNKNNKTMDRNRKVVALEEITSIEKKIDEGSASPSDTENHLNLLHELKKIDNWKYLDHILDRLEFGYKWCSWIKACLSSSRAYILVNGSPTSEFSINRGLRHGDSLSPFLFILVMEGLHNAFAEAVGNGLISGININNSTINISHLFFADDVIITTDWNARDLENIIRVLYVFYLASGLKINIHKSNIYSIGVNEEEYSNMASNADCIAGNIPFNYLGLPIGSNMKSIASWKMLVDRFHLRLSTLKACGSLN
ncbi:RNA-directed DNA polymerase, eukaryota, reverse transcriptase zinc-binding domain protein [Tanacetum coccineum]